MGTRRAAILMVSGGIAVAAWWRVAVGGRRVVVGGWFAVGAGCCVFYVQACQKESDISSKEHFEGLHESNEMSAGKNRQMFDLSECYGTRIEP